MPDQSPNLVGIAWKHEEDTQGVPVGPVWQDLSDQSRVELEGRPSSCPDCGEPCRIHTGTYCHKCGTPLISQKWMARSEAMDYAEERGVPFEEL